MFQRFLINTSTYLLPQKRTKKHSESEHPYREDVFQSEKVSLFCPPTFRKRKRTKKHSESEHPYREDMIQSEKVSLFVPLYQEREKGQKNLLTRGEV